MVLTCNSFLRQCKACDESVVHDCKLHSAQRVGSQYEMFEAFCFRSIYAVSELSHSLAHTHTT